jgi:hypothetical protein
MHNLNTVQKRTASSTMNSVSPMEAGQTELDGIVNKLHQKAADLHGRKDRRGLFFLLYAPTVGRIAKEIRAGNFEQPEKVILVAKELAKRALSSAEGSNEAPRSARAWNSVGRAAKGDGSDLSVLCQALNAHLTIDLPDAIRHAGADASFHNDLQHLGRALVDETIRMQTEPVSKGEKEISTLFNSLPGVPQLENFFGQGAVRRAAYGTLLHEALTQGRLMTAVPNASLFVDAAFHVRNQAIRHLLSGPQQ